jgi:hypothetical protein
MTHLRYHDEHAIKTMSVAELIEELKKFPPELPVMGSWEGIECGIKSVTLESTGLYRSGEWIETAERNPFISLDVDSCSDVYLRGDGTPLPRWEDQPTEADKP